MSTPNALNRRIERLLSKAFPRLRDHALFRHTVANLAFLIDDEHGKLENFNPGNLHIISEVAAKDKNNPQAPPEVRAVLDRLARDASEPPVPPQPVADANNEPPINIDNLVTHILVLLRSLDRTSWKVVVSATLDDVHYQVHAMVQGMCEPVNEAIQRKEIPVPTDADRAD